MKKIYLLIALVGITTGTMYAMNMNNDSDTETDRASQVTQHNPLNTPTPLAFDSDSDEEENRQIISHEQHRQKTTMAISRNQYVTAKKWFTKWTTLYQNNPASSDALENIDLYKHCGSQILNQAELMGHGQKRPFSTMQETMNLIEARVRNAHQTNNQ